MCPSQAFSCVYKNAPYPPRGHLAPYAGEKGSDYFCRSSCTEASLRQRCRGHALSGSLSYGNSDATHTCSFLHVPLNLRYSSNSDISTYLFIKCPHLNSLKSSNRPLLNFIETYTGPSMRECEYMCKCMRIEIRM